MDKQRANTVAVIKEIKLRRNKSGSPSKAPKASPLKGNIKGATNIAPIITPVLLLSNPNVAIKQEVTTKTMKLKFSSESAIKS